MKFLFLMLFMICQNSQAMDYSKYLNSFKKYALKAQLKNEYLQRLNNVNIKPAGISDLPEGLIGLCYPKENIIYVDIEKFDKSSELTRQELIDHELGHCVLLRSHFNESVLTDNGTVEKPTNIMHHQIFEYQSIAQMESFRKELFNPIFYGTYYEVDEKFKKENAELTVANGNVNFEQISQLRRIEHFVIQERLDQYRKGYVKLK